MASFWSVLALGWEPFPLLGSTPAGCRDDAALPKITFPKLGQPFGLLDSVRKVYLRDPLAAVRDRDDGNSYAVLDLNEPVPGRHFPLLAGAPPPAPCSSLEPGAQPPNSRFEPGDLSLHMPTLRSRSRANENLRVGVKKSWHAINPCTSFSPLPKNPSLGPITCWTWRHAQAHCFQCRNISVESGAADRKQGNGSVLLLLDGVGVGRSLGGVDDLVGKALGNGLDVAEGRLADLRMKDP